MVATQHSVRSFSQDTCSCSDHTQGRAMKQLPFPASAVMLMWVSMCASCLFLSPLQYFALALENSLHCFCHLSHNSGYSYKTCWYLTVLWVMLCSWLQRTCEFHMFIMLRLQQYPFWTCFLFHWMPPCSCESENRNGEGNGRMKVCICCLLSSHSKCWVPGSVMLLADVTCFEASIPGNSARNPDGCLSHSKDFP